MVLGLLKWLKETRFYKRKKKIIIETWTLYSMQEVGKKKKLARCFKKWESYISVLKKEKKNSCKKNRIFSLAWNIFYWLLKSHSFEFFGGWKYGFFWAGKLMEIWYLLITKKFLFWTFREWKIQSLLYYWLLTYYCFEFFEGGKYGIFWSKKLMERSFFSQKVDLKIIFTWSFWAFHDILGLGKDGFLCSVSILIAW